MCPAGKKWKLKQLTGGITKLLCQHFCHLSLSHTHTHTHTGGLGLSVLDECITGEELAYGCTGISTAIGTNALAVSNVH